MIKLERTFLAKSLPDLLRSKKMEILDIYIPTFFSYPKIRLRKHGDNYEIEKKDQVDESDFTKFTEESIYLSDAEFSALEREIKGRRIHKMRYYYKWNNMVPEFDIFLGDLAGLVLIDFRFKSVDDISKLKVPLFCLADVTEDIHFSGGWLCGKSYKDIEKYLNSYKYKPLSLK